MGSYEKAHYFNKYMDRGSLASSLKNKETATELVWARRLNIIREVAHALS
jgi:hypothetical protein